ncbi:MAG: M4 family metallopeptidase [Crocinitomicaceae bacterium]
MKKIYVLRSLLLAFMAGFVFNSFSQEIFTGPQAESMFPGAQLVRTGQFSKAPSFVKFRPGNELDLDDFQPWVIKNFQLRGNISFNLIGTEHDKLGHKHYRFQQLINGKAIEHSMWILHTQADKIYSMNGLLYPEIQTPTSASISEQTALNNAISHVSANIYKWELAIEEEHLKRETGDPSATYFPNGELVLVSEGGTYQADSYRLAYKFNIYAHQPVSRTYIYVDASTGEIIFEDEVFHTADVPGTAQTAYSGTQTITTDSFSGQFRLRESGRGNGVNTYDMNTGTNYGSAVDFTDTDNNWNNINADMDEYATDAHWGAEMTYDYYWLIHGRNSIDANGFALNSYVHYDNNYANAFWDGQRMTYGDGNGSWSPLTAIDIAGHEITHGLTTFTADLNYSAESGALNESFSDIFGTCIEHYGLPGNWDWLIGEDIGTALRSMSNPNSVGDPDTYFGNNWASLTGGDNGGVHTNSSVQNYWFYLMVVGGSGTNDNSDAYNVTGIDWTDASAIAFRNLTVYLTPTSQFADARFYSIQSAVDLFGGCTPQVETTTNAWYAVGVGLPYNSTVIADMSAPYTTSCSAPFTVDFQNLSNNGTTFEWDFGDGNTSTSVSPSHTYADTGLYTITLIADGGLCGIDTTTWVDYIDVDTSYACIVILPTSGTGPTQTSCDGTLYDSGGPSSNYGGNEDAQITIQPFGASTVTIDFISFAVEAGTSGNCNYDYVRVYDGPTTSDPLIDTYCNNNVPTTITSTGNALTIVFHSDQGLELAGFQIDWSCNMPTSPPTADFSVNTDTTCSGEVVFTDLSTNGPTSWSWDFGDGNTSTSQNPSHDYTSSGDYTVILTATNLNGSDAVTMVDLIHVDLPTPPTGTGDAICENNTASLSATGTGGTLEWFDAQTGGNSLGTGGNYTTPVLSATTSYWVEETVPGPTLSVGPADNTFGGGGNFTGDQHLIFDCTTPVVLKTVRVYANGGGNRIIELRNSSGTVIQTATVNIPDGEQVVTLNFNVPVGTDLQLGIQTGSSPNLYRNNNSASYPYTSGGGEIVINESSPNPPNNLTYYYFFYDWQIEVPGCVSEREEVIAAVSAQADATIDPVASLCSNDSPVVLTAADAGGTWSGTGVTGNSFDPSSAGAGSHTVTYTIAGTCGDTDNIIIDVTNNFDATITPVSPLCLGDSPVTLTAVDAGGSWSGTGVSGNTFDPATAGVGTHTINYTITGSCGDSDNLDIVVSNNFDATIDPLPSNMCSTDAPVSLNAVDAGGTWSGNGVSGNTFDPSMASSGANVITYTIAGSCGDTDNATISIEETPDATINAAGPFCRYETTYQMTAASTGGTWSADCGTCINSTTGIFDPSASGSGNWTVTYSISGNCPSSDNIIVVVEDCLGLEESENGMSIYPNPSNGILIIEMNESIAGQILIQDVSGKNVYSDKFQSNKVQLDFTNEISDGTYFLTITSNDGEFRTTQKIQIIR